jgi:endonuclease/exonuclease/phosphatase family metal-dependent hydrolase
VRRIAILLAVTASAVAALSPAVSSVSSSFAGSSESSYQLLQMNLCLSGQAGCYSQATYPSILDEATGQIADRDPEAVTLNEVCSADVVELAERTGYEFSFAAVDYGGAPLPCIDPRGRGLFGIAVLTKEDIRSSQDRAFAVQADPEERRWLCATTESAISVCTAHLSTRYTSVERVANNAECRELRSVLARHQEAGTTLFGGDLNRQDPCAPPTMWTSRDTSATQAPGVQHIYGTPSVQEWSTSVDEATYTDHDFLLAAAATTPSG